MSDKLRRVLYWSPRLLGITFCVLLSVFALDVLGEGHGFWRTVQGLLIHLLPVFGLAAVLVVAWREDGIVSLLFAGLALLYFADRWGQESWAAVLAISGSLAVLSLLFLLSWLSRRERAHR